MSLHEEGSRGWTAPLGKGLRDGPATDYQVTVVEDDGLAGGDCTFRLVKG